jgi:hypothetical protein
MYSFIFALYHFLSHLSSLAEHLSPHPHHCHHGFTTPVYTSIMFLDIIQQKEGMAVGNSLSLVDNVQKHDTCINVPSSQTFRSYLQLFMFHTTVHLVMPRLEIYIS